MPEDQEKTFDMTKPGQVSPHASGRPVIVGHHPTMVDPMLRPVHHNPPATPTTPAQPSYIQPDQVPPTQPLAPQPAQPQPSYPQTPAAPATGFEPIGEMPQAPAQVAVPGATPQAPPQQTPATHMAHHELPISDHHKKGFSLRKLLLWVVVPLLVLTVLVYLLLDSGTVNSSINLPFHVFKQKTVVVSKTTNTSGSSTTDSSTSNSNVPAGFSAYDDSALPFTFNYPTLWGTPTVVTEQGFSKRGGGSKADGTYAYLVNFAANKDVQIAVTSSKYLPPARGILYYDFLSWCLSQTDNKYYKSVLTFTTTSGVDTPSSITCNQGPLNDATVVDASTIVQKNTKAPDGASLGDVYTKNLSSADIPVVRVKDATGKNGDNIKIILNTNQASANP